MHESGVTSKLYWSFIFCRMDKNDLLLVKSYPFRADQRIFLVWDCCPFSPFGKAFKHAADTFSHDKCAASFSWDARLAFVVALEIMGNCCIITAGKSCQPCLIDPSVLTVPLGFIVTLKYHLLAVHLLTNSVVDPIALLNILEANMTRRVLLPEINRMGTCVW